MHEHILSIWIQNEKLCFVETFNKVLLDIIKAIQSLFIYF